MRTTKLRLAAALVVLVALAVFALAQGRETYQATARGTGTQMGQMFSVNIIIEQYSSEEDRQLIVAAFERGGTKELSDVLEKMPSKGRIAITGTTGNEIAFVRLIPTANGGKRIRILTTRPIRMPETRNATRSADYDLSAVEMDLSGAKDAKSILLPACQLKVDKNSGEIQIEAYQNPWELVNIIDWSKK
jgi:hypothetical protein